MKCWQLRPCCLWTTPFSTGPKTKLCMPTMPGWTLWCRGETTLCCWMSIIRYDSWFVPAYTEVLQPEVGSWCFSPSVGRERIFNTVVLRELHSVPFHEESPGCQGPAGGSHGPYRGGSGQLPGRQCGHSQGERFKKSPEKDNDAVADFWSITG